MKKYFEYSLQFLLAVIFVAPGIMKLAGDPVLMSVFAGFGYPLWFMYFIGACEVLGGLGILFGGYLDKRLPKLAVVGLTLIMLGAVFSHFRAGDPFIAIIPATINLGLLALYLKLYLSKKTKSLSTGDNDLSQN